MENAVTGRFAVRTGPRFHCRVDLKPSTRSKHRVMRVVDRRWRPVEPEDEVFPWNYWVAPNGVVYHCGADHPNIAMGIGKRLGWTVADCQAQLYVHGFILVSNPIGTIGMCGLVFPPPVRSSLARLVLANDRNCGRRAGVIVNFIDVDSQAVVRGRHILEDEAARAFLDLPTAAEMEAQRCRE